MCPMKFAVKSAVDVRLSGIGKRSAAGRQPIHLPCSNVVEYGLEGDNVIVVRPSGTEPKIKVYFMVKGRSRTEAEALESQLKARMTRRMGF